MGIELPTPTGEQGKAPQTGFERPLGIGSPETYVAPQSAELNTTERPAVQEVNTGHGAGGGTAPQAINDDNQTTDDPTSDTSVPSLDNVPVVAADDDLIEKQWVESVKRVISETRTDPYRQGEAIGRLQRDYLQKRYGRTVGEA